MPTQIQLRRDTAADWTSNNPVLAEGEFGWESDTNRFKIGDGSSNWQNLAYASDGDAAGITFVGDDSSGTLVSQNETFKIAGGTGITTAVSGDTLTITGSGITASSTDTLTNKTFDAEGTGNSLSNVDVANLKSGVLDTDISSVSGSDDTLASAKAIKTYVDAQVAGKDNTDEITEGSSNLYFTNARADARITNALKDEDNMASDSATHVPSQQSVKAYVDAQDANIASDTLTLTNKTIDANGTGNSISNLEVADLASGVLDTDISSVSSSDDTLASAKAIKTYVDAQIATKDNSDEITEGSTNLYFTNARADARITNALKDEDNMASDSATHVPSQQSVKAYVDAQDANIASDTLTLTNKTFDVEATGNSISNIDVADLKSGVLDTDISSVSSSDDTLASAKAIKTYVDAQVATKDALSELSGDTDDVSEGSSNLYFTNARARSAISASGSIGYNSSTGALTYTQGNTDTVSEGSSNLYFTNARADARISNAIVDEDNMASNSATQVPSQQSVKAYVDAEVAGVVDSAPSALNTLNELAAALGDDANFATTTSTALGNRLRIDVNNQGLTSTQKTNAATNLGLNAVATSGAYSDLSGTPTIPSNNNQLTNGAGFITDSNLTIVGDDSSGVTFSAKDNDNIKIAGGTNITTAVSGDTVTITGPDLSSFITGSSTTTLTNKTFDVEGTGNSISNIDVADLKSGVLDTDISSVSSSDDTIASAKAIKTYVDAQIATKDNTDEITEGSSNLYFTNARADARITNALKDEDNFASNSATHVPSQQSVKAYVDAQDANIASDTLTFTNKTFDVEATGNSISNIDVADLKSGVLDTDISSVSGSDDTIASAKAIKTYVDAQIATKDNTDEITEGSSNLYFTNARADARITNALVDEDNMASNSATQLPSQQSVKAYVDAQDANIASDTLTFTNKTFDVEGTGNSISNIDVADLKSGVLDTDISSVSSSDDTLASAKAIKTYVDAQIATKDNTDEITEGSSNLYFTDARAQAVSINNLSEDTSPQLGGNLDVNGQDIVTTSNANIDLAPNGTGKTVLKGNTNPGTLVFNCENNSHGQTVKAQPHSASVTNVLTLPAGGDQEIVGTAATQTLTNKTLTSPVLNTGVSGTAILDEDNMASNSATQLATQQSIKAYVDAEVSGAGGGGVTVQDEGSALSTTATTLNFVGSGVTASGTGATKTITISGGGGSASTGDITFSGNKMSTSSSNADFELETSGTGAIILKGNGGSFPAPGISTSSNRTDNANILFYDDQNHTIGSKRVYANQIHLALKMDGTNSSSSNARFRALNANNTIDMNGTEQTNSGGSRGPQAGVIYNDIFNSSSTTAVVGNIAGLAAGNYFKDSDTGTNGTINVTNAYGIRSYSPMEIYNANVGTVTNSYSSFVGGPIDYASSGGATVTNSYGYYYKHYNADSYDVGGDANAITFTNRPYCFYTNNDDVRSRIGAVEKFNEWSYSASHSGNGAYTIDYDNGNLQTVTLGANITGFTMSNFPTDANQSVGITLYLVQDGTGSRTMTFSATGGETFKFANGVNSSTVSSANDIQTVYIFSRYTGSANIYYWTLGPVYS